MDKNLRSVVAELKKASRMHAAQAKKLKLILKLCNEVVRKKSNG